jgi:pimeloyl-[acyl-carrier protein] methyl ester esterase
VLEVVPERAWWLGWSLGGLVALAAARHPGSLRGVTLLATSPRFVTAADWTKAMDAVVFDEFARQLQEDVARTLSRFLSLQVRSADGSAETLRRLRSQLAKKPPAASEALSSGLSFLRQADMRQVLAETELPLFWLLGERDTLVPAGVRHEFPDVRAAVIAGAAHAPFLSHPEACTEQLKSWLLAQGGVGV